MGDVAVGDRAAINQCTHSAAAVATAPLHKAYWAACCHPVMASPVVAVFSFHAPAFVTDVTQLVLDKSYCLA